MKSKKQVLWLTQAAVIAALYAALTVLQGIIAPGTASMAVQFRVSEAMTLLCCITPAAIPGLTLGCFLANFLFMDALPVDMILGSLATLLAGLAMYALRKVQWKKLPLLAALMPAVFNGIIIGLEIEIFFIEGPFHFSSCVTVSMMCPIRTTASRWVMKSSWAALTMAVSEYPILVGDVL